LGEIEGTAQQPLVTEGTSTNNVSTTTSNAFSGGGGGSGSGVGSGMSEAENQDGTSGLESGTDRDDNTIGDFSTEKHVSFLLSEKAGSFGGYDESKPQR